MTSDRPEDWPDGGPASPPEIVVPDLVGMKVKWARATAQEALLFLEREDPDGPPLVSGVVYRQDPPAGAVVVPFSRIVAWVTDEAGDDDDPGDWDPGGGGGPGGWGPDDGGSEGWDPGGGGPGGGGPPPSGDREPRSPAPLSGAGREYKEAETPVPG